jgi:hypothetical protein
MMVLRWGRGFMKIVRFMDPGPIEAAAGERLSGNRGTKSARLDSCTSPDNKTMINPAVSGISSIVCLFY